MDWMESLVERCAPVVRGALRVVVVLVCVGAVVTLARVCAGCGATPRQQHDVLNRITDVADPTYEAAIAGCDAARDVIVDRDGTTYEEDSAAMDEINAVCDPMVLGFEALRGSQLSARAAIDSGVDAAISTAILEALRLWAQLQALVPDLDALGRE